jgi:competence protein CoiA
LLFTFSDDGLKIWPQFSGQIAICDLCRNPIVAKCGDIVIPHWAHLSGHDCDTWYEPMTEWHVLWQQVFEADGADIEVRVNRNGHVHRADVMLENGVVVELQHSSISPKEIRERELFYGPGMVWIFDIRDAHDNERFYLNKERGEQHTFRWEHPRKSIAFAKRKVYLDLGKGWLFHLLKMYTDPPCAGIGELIPSIDLTYFLAIA